MSNMLLFQQDSHLLTTKELAGKKKAKGKLSAQIRRKRKLCVGNTYLVGKANNAKNERNADRKQSFLRIIRESILEGSISAEKGNCVWESK